MYIRHVTTASTDGAVGSTGTAVRYTGTYGYMYGYTGTGTRVRVLHGHGHGHVLGSASDSAMSILSTMPRSDDAEVRQDRGRVRPRQSQTGYTMVHTGPYRAIQGHNGHNGLVH